MKVDIQANFSFKKLARSWDKIVREHLEKFPPEAAKLTKKKLESGRLKPLTPFTLEMRKKGRGWSGKKVGKTSSKRPLNQTGTLLRSIKANKNALEMKAYGMIQEKGFISMVQSKGMKVKFIQVPPRPFIQLPIKKGKFEFTAFGGRYTKIFDSKSTRAGRQFFKVFWKKIHRALRTGKKLPAGVHGITMGKNPFE